MTAEAVMAAKRRDYFAAGTRVVWDVDLLSETVVVRKYTAEDGAERPASVFARSEAADAHPAVRPDHARSGSVRGLIED
ncbi:MAG: hypothetical protein H7Z41_03475 [Cytophagales bacterium]|nr:hypothetical protein [Armatimonadota bacterium]